MAKSIIIIGAGIAGLSAGCYAQMNGYRSQIYEMHKIPGGLCTSWRRRGYLFDGSLRYLFRILCCARPCPSSYSSRRPTFP